MTTAAARSPARICAIVVTFNRLDHLRQTVARLLASQLQIPELPAPITFSAGVIRIRDYLTVAEATDLADALLYHVKQHGKHNIAYYQGQEIRLIRDPGTNPVT